MPDEGDNYLHNGSWILTTTTASFSLHFIHALLHLREIHTYFDSKFMN